MAARSPLAEKEIPERERPVVEPWDETLVAYLAGLTVEERLRLNDSALHLQKSLRTAARASR